MASVTFNGESHSISSIEEFGVALNDFNATEQFEIWVSVQGGPSMCMLRNGQNAWLMYLRFEGDSGFVSQAPLTKPGAASYVLANGQVDEYPLAWCINIEQCYKAMAYFFVNDGAMPSWVSWYGS